MLPNTLTRISNGTFNACFSLESVVIPESVTEIGSSAFAECRALKGIDIPDKVNKIESRAFENCFSIESVIIPDLVTRLDYMAFAGCSSLKNVTISMLLVIATIVRAFTSEINIWYKNPTALSLFGTEQRVAQKTPLCWLANTKNLSKSSILTTAFIDFINKKLEMKIFFNKTLAFFLII